jgi:hypothetical protein
MSAACTTTLRTGPVVSTSKWHLRPLASWRRQSCAAPLFRRLDRLAVQDCRARGRFSSRVPPGPLAQRGVRSFPNTILAPAPKVVIDGLPGKIVGQEPPGFPTTQYVQNAVNDFPPALVGRPTPLSRPGSTAPRRPTRGRSDCWHAATGHRTLLRSSRSPAGSRPFQTPSYTDRL